MENKKQRGPKSKLGAVLQSLLITAVVGFIYFYVSLPALNLQDRISTCLFLCSVWSL